MFMAYGKRTGRALMATSAFGQNTSHLFFILERTTHHRLLVDTGAEVSVIPA